MLAAALLLRASSAPDLGTGELVRDARTADHLRRIQLALGTGHTPLDDHFLDAPRGAEIPEPPLFDAMLAAAAELALRAPGGPRETGSVDEEPLEQFLARIPFLLLLLTVFAVVAAVRALEQTASSDWAACAAGLLVVLPSLAAGQSGVARIESASWLGALAALIAWRSAVLLAARDPLDVVLAGLVLGFLASLALASGAAAILLVPLPVLAFWSFRSRGTELTQGARRGGILYGIVLVVLGGLAHESLAPSDHGGLATSWIETLPWIGACALAPHLAAWLIELWRAGKRARALVSAAGFVLLATLSPRAIAALGSLAGASFHARAFAAELAGDSDRALAWTSLAFASVAALVGFAEVRGAALLVPGSRARSSLFGLAALAAAVAACAFPLLSALAAPLAAIALGRALASLAQVRRNLAIAVGALALVASAAIGWTPRAPVAPRAAIAGLRWMREGTPSAGPWNAAWTPKSWSVLAPWTAGGLVAYHARRPPLSSTWEPWLDRRESSAGLALAQAANAQGLVERLRALDVHYVLGGAWVAAEWRRSLDPCSAIVREAYETGALASLVRGEAEVPDGLHAVWTSAPDPSDSGPALVIYELARAEGSSPGPELRSR